MIITSIETTIIAVPYDHGGPHGSFAGKPWNRMETLLVRVETDDGLAGWGEAFGHATNPITKLAIDTIIAPLVLGRDARDINGITQAVLHGTHLMGRNSPLVYGFSGVEIALWDLLGKRSNQSICRLLGGNRAEVPAYSSLMFYGSDEIAAKNAVASVKAGFKHVKLHERTAAAVALVKPQVGDARIMVDVNCAYPVVEARKMADDLALDDVDWLEEPLWPPEDLEGLASVRGRGTPIAAGENVAGMFGFKALIDAGAIDIAQPSVSKLGGIGEMVKVIQLCHSRGIQVRPHSAYFGPGLIATIHVQAALLRDPLVEVFWANLEASPFDPWIRPVNAMMKVPQGPGLGVEPDLKVIERYRVGETTVTKKAK